MNKKNENPLNFIDNKNRKIICMKNIAKLVIGLLIVSNLIACSSSFGKKTKLETNADTVSYMLGVSISMNLETFPGLEELDLELIGRGIKDGLTLEEPEFAQAEINQILQKYFTEQQAKEAETAVQEGKDFLAKNKEEEGVVETESGLQYRVMTEGSGNLPIETDRVKVHYVGRLLNGDVFDSSRERGEPAEFALNQVIKGWTEGLQLMKEGSVYEFFIPSELAYGERPMGDKIKANSTLIFEVELIEILK